MGNCKQCGKSIKIVEGEKNCPNCNQNPYFCHSCSGHITGETKECPVCHFFVCPSCGTCGPDCNQPELLNAIKTMLPEEALNYIVNVLQGKVRLNCPRGVPISYGKSKLRSFILKILHNKKPGEADAFKERIDIIEKFPIGKTWTINAIKLDGEYGQELREASFFSICMGLAEKIMKFNTKTNKRYFVFKRIQQRECTNVNFTKLKVEGRKSHCDFCSLARKHFKKIGDDIGIDRSSGSECREDETGKE